MNNSDTAFDPSLSKLFLEKNIDRNRKKQNNFVESRQLFYQLNQPQKFTNILPIAYDFIAFWLDKTQQIHSSSIDKNYKEKKLINLKPIEIEALPEKYLTQDNLNKILKQSTPIVLTQPNWLQNTSMIAYSQSKIATRLLALYLQLTKANNENVTPLNSYRSLLLATGLKTPTLHDYSYNQQTDFTLATLDLATIQLTLARFPRVLLPEILGFTLAYCQMSTLIEICIPNHQLPSHFFKQQNHQLKLQLPLLRDFIIDYLELFPQQKQVLWQRIQKGFWLYQFQTQRCKDQFKELLDHPSLKKQPNFKKLITTKYLSTKKITKLSNKELYYQLVNLDLFPDVLPIAKAKTKRLLSVCAWFNPPPFKHYDHEQFDAYLENIYQQEVADYQPLQNKPKISKEAYVWGIEQISPMILIDGCWLQNSLILQTSHPEICEILFSIYCDEIGNGQLEQNHPYIFQQLLDSLSIKLPSAHSREFIEHPGFINSAFTLPVYMLSLSSCSVEFLPELLGLNMAIELSGLGKDYKRLVDEWNYWGIDPTIAKIHISIDNVASGHTFLAKKAIQLYMDDLFHRTGDKKIWDKHWRRIYSGYASLRFVGGWFKLSLPLWYLSSKFRAKL